MRVLDKTSPSHENELLQLSLLLLELLLLELQPRFLSPAVIWEANFWGWPTLCSLNIISQSSTARNLGQSFMRPC